MPFKDLTATGTAIVTTIAAGVTGAAQVLANAVIGVFAGAFSFLTGFAPLEGENIVLDDLGEESLEGPMRAIIGFQSGLHFLAKDTNSAGLFLLSEGISSLAGAVLMYDTAVKTMGEEGDFWSLGGLASYIRYRAPAEGLDNIYDGLLPLANFVTELQTDIKYAEDKLKDGVTLDSLNELSDLLNRKYDPESQLGLSDHTGNIAYVEMLTAIVDGFNLINDVIENFEWPDWKEKGVTLVQSFISGIQTALLGTSDSVEPLSGQIIEGQKGSLTGLIETGTSIVQSISDGVTSAQQVLYDAINGVFTWVKDLLFPSSDAKEGAFSDLMERGKLIITTIGDGITKAKDSLGTSLKDAFDSAIDSAMVAWEALPNRIQSILFGSPDSTIDIGSGIELTIPGTPGVMQQFSGFWIGVGNKLKDDWDSYIETGWPTHRDLIQDAIWSSIFPSLSVSERPENVTFSDFWKSVGSALKTDWDIYLSFIWPSHRDLIQSGIWNSLTGTGGENERPEGVTFSAFWTALGSALKTDWDSYIETDWPTHRDLIQDAIWGTLFSDDVIKPDGVSFLNFWKGVGAQIKTDFDSFIQNDWPTIKEEITSSILSAIASIFGVGEGEQGQSPEEEVSDALSDSLNPALQLGASQLAMGQADRFENQKLWHAGRHFGLWKTEER